MTFFEARAAAAKFGAKPPAFYDGRFVMDCWIDRIALLVSVAERGGALGDYIDDANRYSGR